jgi:hypothetical protein
LGRWSAGIFSGKCPPLSPATLVASEPAAGKNRHPPVRTQCPAITYILHTGAGREH